VHNGGCLEPHWQAARNPAAILSFNGCKNRVKNTQKIFLPTAVFILLGIGLWLGLKDNEPRDIINAIGQIGWSGLILVCSLSLINYFLRYIRWRYLLTILGDKTGFLDGMLCYVAGFALTTTPGKAGEAVRCIYLKERHNVPHPHTLSALLSERASDALAGALLASVAFYTFQNNDIRTIGIVFTAAIFSIILLLNQPALLTRLLAPLQNQPVKVLQKFVAAIPLFLQRSATLLSIKPLGAGTLIGFVSWSAEAYGFAWLAIQLGGEASIWLYMSIFAIGMIAGAISFLPGGLGTAEAAMYLLLIATGMDSASAVIVTLVCRLATLWFAILLGLLAVLWLGKSSTETGDSGD
jgi:uncharacterized protein (TIRG00374 family)